MIPPSSNSPVSTPIWSNQSSPTMKGVSSRFSRATSSRDLDLESELIRADIYRQQQLIDNFSNPSFGSDYFEEIEARINPLHQNMNYSSGLPSSPLRMSSQIMNSRSAAFAKRSQSFIDRGTANRQLGVPTMAASKLSDWGSPDGKLNWGIQKDELNKLRKSASFGVRGSGNNVTSEEDQYFSPWVEDQLVA